VTGVEKDLNAELSPAQLLAKIDELTRRVEWLEASLGDERPAPTVFSPDVVLAISAAVAAYLGKRATVRQIHLTGSTNWARQGRTAVMATHDHTHGSR